MDRITGPFGGYYVASSASPIGGLGDRYLGFAKVCCQRPSSFWLATLCTEPGCCAHLCGGGLFDSAAEAIANAEVMAQAHVRNRAEAVAQMPSAAEPVAPALQPH